MKCLWILLWLAVLIVAASAATRTHIQLFIRVNQQETHF